jgi:CRISPR-associated endonuclease/helicase Cas3
MERYYAEYFYKRKNEMDYNTQNTGTLYDLLSRNTKGFNAYINSGGKMLPALRQAFQTAGKNFYVIDRGTTGVLVPYARGIELMEEYQSASLPNKAKLLREMGRYSVSLYDWQINKLKKEQALFTIGDGVLALRKDYYDAERGVMLNKIVEG